MKKTIITVFILLFVTSIILPWWLLTDVETMIQVVTSLLGALASLGTLFIAFLLYDKFGINQKIVNHQVDLVERVLRNLKSLILNVYDSSSGKVQHVRQNLSTSGLVKKGFLINFENYNESFKEIIEIEKDIYLPKEILQKLYSIHFKMLEGPTNNEDNIYYILIFMGPSYSIEKKPKEWALVDEGKTDIIQYLLNFNSLITICTDWIKEHSSKGIDMNI